MTDKIITLIILLLSIGFLFSDVGELLENSMNTVDQVFSDELSRLENIALDQEVQSGNWQLIKASLISNEEERTEALYWYSLPDGSYYTSEKDKVEANLSDRGYFPDLLMGKAVVGFPITGKTSGRKSVVVAVPVMKDGEVTGILGTSFFLDDIWDILKQKIGMPETYDFYAIHPMGITMFDLETKDNLLDNILEQSSETLVEAVKTMIASKEGIVKYEWDGQEKTARFITSPVTGWRYIISYY